MFSRDWSCLENPVSRRCPPGKSRWSRTEPGKAPGGHGRCVFRGQDPELAMHSGQGLPKASAIASPSKEQGIEIADAAEVPGIGLQRLATLQIDVDDHLARGQPGRDGNGLARSTLRPEVGHRTHGVRDHSGNVRQPSTSHSAFTRKPSNSSSAGASSIPRNASTSAAAIRSWNRIGGFLTPGTRKSMTG